MSHLILVVDDEVDVRRFLTAVLEKRGYDVVTAEDGRQAYGIAEQQRPDLIVLDLQMPSQTGTDFYRRLMKHDELREIPIIVVSGPLSWPFFAAVKQGFDDAAEIFDIDYQYVAVTDTANMTSDYPRLLQQAISRNPAMLLVGEFFPDGMDPLIKEATAAGIPVPGKGERVKIYIVLKEGETATEEEFIAFCKENLAPYKVPKFVEFRAELPKTLVGKVLRRVLVEEELKRQVGSGIPS